MTTTPDVLAAAPVAPPPSLPGDTRRLPWEVRLASIAKKYPVTMWGADEFHEVLSDYDLLGRVYRDVLRVGYEPPRRGQRSPLEWSDGTARMRAMAVERSGQATSKPFPDALRELADGLGTRALSNRTGITRSQIGRLRAGTIVPTMAEIELVAAAFDKPPTYFPEYRVALICATLAENLANAPERSIDILVRMGVQPGPDLP